MNTVRGFLIAIILITGMGVAYCASQNIEQGTYSCAFICGSAIISLGISSLQRKE